MAWRNRYRPIIDSEKKVCKVFMVGNVGSWETIENETMPKSTKFLCRSNRFEKKRKTNEQGLERGLFKKGIRLFKGSGQRRDEWRLFVKKAKTHKGC